MEYEYLNRLEQIESLSTFLPTKRDYSSSEDESFLANITGKLASTWVRRIADLFKRFDARIEIEQELLYYNKELELQKGMVFHRRVRRARMEGNTPWISLEDNMPEEILNVEVPLPSILHLVYTDVPQPIIIAPVPRVKNYLAWHTITLSDYLEKPENKIFSKQEGYGRYNTVWHEWEIPG